VLDPLANQEVAFVNQSGLALAIPLHLRYVAGDFRIVGTSLEYLQFRQLQFSQGRYFAILGECVLGAAAAEKLGLKPGDHLLSSPAGAFDVAGNYPLKMKVVGILQKAGTLDDEAIFVDVKTSWVIAGLAHGHKDVTQPEAESGVMKREENNVVANASVLSYTEITPENINSFHFHGNPDDFPLDAIIAVPKDRKSGIVLRGRYEERADPVQILVPKDIINELLETVFSIRDYILMGSIGVGFATLATAFLVFMLSIRIRQREIQTIRKIGGSGRRLRAILASEILLVIGMSALIAGGLTLLVSRFGMSLAGMFFG
jgi:putative ABC transport system permease protein